MSVPVAVLRDLPLLASLPTVTIDHLARLSSERSFSKREVVLQKDARSHALCFLVEGRLQGMDFTLDGREVGLYFVNPRDYFGDIALIDGMPHPEFVTSVARSTVLFVPQESIRPILFSAPKVAEALCASLALRLRKVSAQRRILGLANPLQRVCAQLELLLHTDGGKVRVRNAPTHQELAIMINASRETVTRVFQLLQSRGVVERDGNDLKIEDPIFLGDVAAGRKNPGN